MGTIKTQIRILLPYINHGLEQLSSDLNKVLKELTSNGEQKIRLKLDSDSEIFFTPKVNEHCIVTIGESFLCYVWAMCYYGSVFFDEAIVPRQEIKLGKIKRYDFTLADDAILLREWALSMYYGYVDWPDDLPNPTEVTNKYIELANEYFIFAICFIIEHEIAHLYLNHLDGNKSIHKEIEADRQAVKWHLERKEGRTFISKMGVLLGLCSMLALNSQSEKSSDSHPSMYSRIQQYIDSLDDDNKERYYQVFALYIWDWDKQFCKNNDFDLETVNFEDFVNGVLNQMRLVRQ